MAKFCPVANRKIVYLDCQECAEKECRKENIIKNSAKYTKANLKIIQNAENVKTGI